MAELKIYDSISAAEPSKVYACHRTTMDINTKLEDLTAEVNDVTRQINSLVESVTEETPESEVKRIKAEVKKLEETATKLTLETIRLFFPEFTDEDFAKLDPYDYQMFVLEIGEMRGKIFRTAAKN
jgi:predicted nuclease with TOPRIM domain